MGDSWDSHGRLPGARPASAGPRNISPAYGQRAKGSFPEQASFQMILPTAPRVGRSLFTLLDDDDVDRHDFKHKRRAWPPERRARKALKTKSSLKKKPVQERRKINPVGQLRSFRHPQGNCARWIRGLAGAPNSKLNPVRNCCSPQESLHHDDRSVNFRLRRDAWQS